MVYQLMLHQFKNNNNNNNRTQVCNPSFIHNYSMKTNRSQEYPNCLFRKTDHFHYEVTGAKVCNSYSRKIAPSIPQSRESAKKLANTRNLAVKADNQVVSQSCVLDCYSGSKKFKVEVFNAVFFYCFFLSAMDEELREALLRNIYS